MYDLVRGKPFKQDMALKLLILDFPPIYDSDGMSVTPYRQEQTHNITSEFALIKNYYDTASNIATASLISTLTMPSRLPQTPTPKPLDGTHQCHSMTYSINLCEHTDTQPPTRCVKNMMTFLSLFNPQDLPELLFK